MVDGNSRPNAGFRGGRQSYHPPGMFRESQNNYQRNNFGSKQNFNDSISSSTSISSAAERPKLNLKPRSVPVSGSERQLTERSRSIFGVGKPRESSPVNEKLANLR